MTIIFDRNQLNGQNYMSAIKFIHVIGNLSYSDRLTHMHTSFAESGCFDGPCQSYRFYLLRRIDSTLLLNEQQQQKEQ